MLENRPIAKKGLYGTGAFAFIFGAAMAGTAFMITGGVGHDDFRAADPPAYQIAANDSWASTAETAAPQRISLVSAPVPTAAAEDRFSDESQVSIGGAVAPREDTDTLSGENDTAPTTEAATPVPLDPPAKF